ncbi:MAG: hypothetical protein FJX47_10740, partial [Alphaproteobacteria bacterium]|nr:hypothetical protein [Alphaproteobacteria bacterium]
IIRAISAAVILALGASVALAQDRRVALVIGNDAYTGLPKLNNAARDAEAVGRKLRELGFETTVRTNVGRVALNRAVADFGSAIAGKAETVGLVFYAGHGIQAMDRNWLVPVDAQLESDIDLRAEAVDAQMLLQAMDDARNALNIVILDACRDNPLPKRQRSAERGLAIMSVAPRGSVIAYSASPNQKAQDGSAGGNGVYTAELLKALDEPGLKIEDVFKRANGGVQRATGGRQVPWFNASIQGDFFFRPGAPGAIAAPSPSAPAPVDPATVELAYWNSVKDSQSAGEYEAYLKEYPKGRFASLARTRIAALTPKPVPTAPKPVQPAVGTYGLAPGQVFRDCADCPEMVVIPAGSFIMGSPEGEEERQGMPDSFKGNSVPQHRVKIRSFMLGKYEVTFEQYDQCAAENACPWADAHVFGRGNRPVINVNWDDAKAYTAWLSRKIGKSYRLPSEAEWEYAARAGTSTARHWGEYIGRNNANCDGCGSQWDGKSEAPVGSFRTNGFGLHDMIGNVWEWTEDCWNDNYNGAPTDGSAWQYGKCEIRVLRGGSWFSEPGEARSASRRWQPSDFRFEGLGFRLARSLD